jgi:hypothetical protein
MKKLSVLLLAVFGLSSCSSRPVVVTVFGGSGSPFAAPSLCAALTQCLNSKESVCYYEREAYSTAQGLQYSTECKGVTK